MDFSWEFLWSLAVKYSAILSVLGAIISVLFTFFSKRSLAKQQSAYTAQIETLKNQLAYSLARKSKFADKEFEVLAECWKSLQTVHKSFLTMTTSLQTILSGAPGVDLLELLGTVPQSRCEWLLDKIGCFSKENDKKEVAEKDGNSRLQLFLLSFLNEYIQNSAKPFQSFIRYYDDNSIFLDDFLQSETSKTIEFVNGIYNKIALLLNESYAIQSDKCNKEFVKKILNSALEIVAEGIDKNHTHFENLREIITEKLRH